MATINIEEKGSTRRNRLSREIVLSIRTLMQQPKPDALSKDLTAHIILCLYEISQTIDQAVAAWEKRDYWVKADRYKMEWLWVDTFAQDLKTAIIKENWGEIAHICLLIGQKFRNVEVSPNHRLGTPWVGAWKKFKAQDTHF